MRERVKEILEAEARAIQEIPLDESVDKAIEALLNCKGKVFTIGMGKAGYVAKKAASTFSTTGTPSVFVHPGDALHGDVGVITDKDVLIAISNSGKTREVKDTIFYARKLSVSKVISICATADSPIATKSDIQLCIGKIVEPCPLQFTPSSSTSAMIALCDALALVTMEKRGFSKEDFAIRHHGGYLGEKSRN